MNYLRTDLLHDNIFRSLMIFAIPIMMANFFQQLYNTADIMIVGNCLGDDALAAVGATSPLYELLVGFALGVGNGMAIVTARFYGMGDSEKLKKSVAGSIVIGILLTAVIMVIAAVGLYPMLRMLDTPAEIIDEAYTYIQFITMAVGVMFAYNLLAGLLRAIGDSFTPLLFLILSSVLNIVLDIVLIEYTDMGIMAAALATVVSQGVSAVLCLVFILKKCRLLIPEKSHFRPEADMYKELAGQGFSMGFMLSIVSLGTVILQYSVNGLGKLVIAGHTAARKLSYFCMMPENTLGAALSTFVSQNRGADNHDRIQNGIKCANIVSAVYALIIAAVLWAFSPQLIALISGSSEPVIIENGALYMRINVIFYPILGIVFNLRSSLQGLGRKVIPLAASILECIGKIVFVAVLNPVMGYYGVIICEPAIWIIMAVQLIYSIRHDRYMRRLEPACI